MKKLWRNKKGFTLIELLATISIMAILAGVAVPSIYYSTARRQRSSAEADTQQMYRNAISCISDLASRHLTPTTPYSRFETYVSGEDTYKYDDEALKSAVGYELMLTATGSANGWYIEYEKQLVKKLYATITALDIPIYYYYPMQNPSQFDTTSTYKTDYPWLRIPAGCSSSERSTFVTAGNKNPYIVVQVVKIVEPNETSFNNFLIISYHNDKKPFNYTATLTPSQATSNGASINIPNLTVYDAYETNKENDIIYSFRIR